ncbi:uncharacterized protein HHUB_3510 [Halobacterium hubeiense]|uniref:Uncharacterized protein n=1 Tax=Halobacterium hubeiense TaxID=1407499 RepID=A0A0U5H4P4_9EURY|nr:uncharacterized protein HHUB_3510 [Halobacterium hubeiense]
MATPAKNDLYQLIDHRRTWKRRRRLTPQVNLRQPTPRCDSVLRDVRGAIPGGHEFSRGFAE